MSCHTNVILLRRSSRTGPEGRVASTFPPIYFIHTLHPRRNMRKRCSEKLTCTAQMDTPSFLTRRLRELKKHASSRKHKTTRLSWHAAPKTSVSSETYAYAWEVKLNHKKQSNGWCKRQVDASLWHLSVQTQVQVGKLKKKKIIKKEEKQQWLQTFMGLSMSPPHRDCRGIRKGLQVGFKLFFTTWQQNQRKPTCWTATAKPDVIVIKNIRRHAITFLLKQIFARKTWLEGIQSSRWWGKPSKAEEALAEFTSVLWASCHPVAVCLKNSRYGSDFPKKSWKWEACQWISWISQKVLPNKPPIPCYLISLLQPQNSPPCYLLFPPHRSKVGNRNGYNNGKTLWRHFSFALRHSQWWFLFLRVICSSALVVGSVFCLTQSAIKRE